MKSINDRKLLLIVKLLPIALVVLFISLLLALSINDLQKRTAQLEERLEREIIEANLSQSRKKVEAVLQQIASERSQTVQLLKEDIKQRTVEAHALLSSLYVQTQDIGFEQPELLLKEALRNIRFNEDRGYFFIYQLDGINIMHALLPHIEGEQRIGFKSQRNVPILKEHIDAILASGVGEAYYRWWFPKPGAAGEFEKIGFGKVFEPYNWFIGTGEYVYEVERSFKKTVLRWLSHYRYGNQGYLTILDKHGNVLTHHEPQVVGQYRPDLLNKVKQAFDVSQKNNVTFEHVAQNRPHNKVISYVSFYPEWQWYVSYSLDLSVIQKDIDEQILQIRDQYKQDLTRTVILLSGFAAVLVLLSFVLSRYLTQRFVQYQQHINENFEQLNNQKEQLRHYAEHDTLTGLPSRLLLDAQFSEMIKQAQVDHTNIAVGFIDIDNFKYINDKYGHEIGDQVLRGFAHRIVAACDDHDIVARFGGDEFVLCFADAQTHKVLEEKANTLLKEIQAPLPIRSLELELYATIGIAMYPHDGGNLEALMSKADMALTRGKQKNKGQVNFYDKKINSEIARTRAIEQEFKHAVDNDEVYACYQAQVDAKTHQITGYEALCRWDNKNLGFIRPDVFIDIAERTGEINKLGAFMLDRACRDLVSLQANSSSPITMSVNISPKQILATDFIEVVTGTVDKYSLDPSAVILEITENVMVDDLETIRPKLHALSQFGFVISLDDFGTGYSSLSYLNSLPIREIKIDRSFVDRMLDKQSSYTIVKTIIAIAQSNHMKVVAEGVEQIEQSQELAKLGCNIIQGYYFAKPLRLEALLDQSAETTID